MILALLAAAAMPPVEQAERAFASMALAKGQWTAFRAFAAPDALMLIDGPQPALPFLQDKKDPPVAVMWWPAYTVTSCDGTLAFSTGPWRRDGGRSTGHYFTIWRRDASGWRWLFDGGSQAKDAEAAEGIPAGDRVSAKKPAICHAPPPPPDSSAPLAGGASKDGSLRWRVDKAEKGYRLRVLFSPGEGWTKEADVIVG